MNWEWRQFVLRILSDNKFNEEQTCNVSCRHLCVKHEACHSEAAEFDLLFNIAHTEQPAT